MSFGRAHFVSKRPMDSCPTTDQLQKYQEKVEKTVNGMSVKCARSPSAKQLVVTTPRTSRFYLLPTIHNPDLGRPIVSNCTFPTENISSHLDEVMAHLVRSLPTYVKDTNHALHLFDSFRFDTTILDNAFCSPKRLQRVLL